MDLREGSIIKTYRLMKKLGDGASGEVWHARDLESPRDVAIKLMHTHLFESPQKIHRERFEREIEAVKKLGEHPNIPTFYDQDLEFKPPYFAMQYIRGAGVDTMVQEQVISRILIQKRVDIIKQISDALAYAHREGYIHRDIKPSNVKIIGDDTAYLLDFSVAFVEEDTSKTQLGIGTPLYMPPEVFPSKAGDIFSLALVAFEILYGQHAIFRDSDIIMNSADAKRLMDERLMDVSWDLPSHLPTVKGLSEKANFDSLDRVFSRALAHKPTERYEDANEFSNALEEALAPTMLQVDENVWAADTDPYGIGTPTYHEERTQLIVNRDTELPVDTHNVVEKVSPEASAAHDEESHFDKRRLIAAGVFVALIALALVAALFNNESDSPSDQGSITITVTPSAPASVIVVSNTAPPITEAAIVMTATDDNASAAATEEALTETVEATEAPPTTTNTPAPPSDTPEPSQTPLPTLAPTLRENLSILFDRIQQPTAYPCYTLSLVYEAIGEDEFPDSETYNPRNSLLSTDSAFTRLYNFCVNESSDAVLLPISQETANDELIALLNGVLRNPPD